MGSSAFQLMWWTREVLPKSPVQLPKEMSHWQSLGLFMAMSSLRNLLWLLQWSAPELAFLSLAVLGIVILAFTLAGQLILLGQSRILQNLKSTVSQIKRFWNEITDKGTGKSRSFYFIFVFVTLLNRVTSNRALQLWVRCYRWRSFWSINLCCFPWWHTHCHHLESQRRHCQFWA